MWLKYLHRRFNMLLLGVQLVATPRDTAQKLGPGTFRRPDTSNQRDGRVAYKWQSCSFSQERAIYVRHFSSHMMSVNFQSCCCDFGTLAWTFSVSNNIFCFVLKNAGAFQTIYKPTKFSVNSS